MANGYPDAATPKASETSTVSTGHQNFGLDRGAEILAADVMRGAENPLRSRPEAMIHIWSLLQGRGDKRQHVLSVFFSYALSLKRGEELLAKNRCQLESSNTNSNQATSTRIKRRQLKTTNSNSNQATSTRRRRSTSVEEMTTAGLRRRRSCFPGTFQQPSRQPCHVTM